MSNNILLYEELSANAHPAIRTHLYDGWILRFADGYTNRANSVNPLYSSTIAIKEKISFCEQAYSTQGLPSVFKLTPSSGQGLDGILQENGYEVVTPTNLMTKPLTANTLTPTKTFIRPAIDQYWQDNFFRLNGITDNQKKRTAATIHGNIQNKVVCGMITDNPHIIACGLCVIEREYAGLYDITVDASYRGQGYGYDICASLLNAAVNTGAKTAYLQVVSTNAAAIALYKKLGFKDSYQYWYRIKRMY